MILRKFIIIRDVRGCEYPRPIFLSFAIIKMYFMLVLIKAVNRISGNETMFLVLLLVLFV